MSFLGKLANVASGGTLGMVKGIKNKNLKAVATGGMYGGRKPQNPRILGPTEPQVDPRGQDQGMAAFRNWRQSQGPQGVPGGNMAPGIEPQPQPQLEAGMAGGNMPDPNLQAPQLRQPIPRGGYTGRGFTTNASSSPMGRGVGSIGGGYDF